MNQPINKPAAKPEKITFREQVAGEMIRQIEAGTAPWQKPWEAGRANLSPQNPVTDVVYRGINNMWLDMQGHNDPRWLTYKQAASTGAQVRKGEKATSIEYWQWSEQKLLKGEDGKPKLDADGQKQYQNIRLERPKVFYAKVFNGSQIDGLEPLVEPARDYEFDKRADKILNGSGIKIHRDQQDRAFYSISQDQIHIPPAASFNSQAEFYATALHELGHATGHGDRLARKFGPFGSEVYAKEELRAEISSLMVAKTIGIAHNPENHAAYAKSWLKVLRDDPSEIFRAARDAEIIKTWLTEPEKRQELEWTAQQRKQAEQSEKAEQRQEEAMSKQPEQHAKPSPEKTSFKNARVYLAVPFEEKDTAKAAGAKWDRKQKSWYAPDKDNLVDLERWRNQEAGSQKESELDPTREFGLALQGHGLKLDGLPQMDGEWHRVQVEDDKKGQKSGSYRGFLDGLPAGQITNYKLGDTQNWVATGQTSLSPEQLKANRAEVNQRREQRSREQAETHKKAAKQAYGVIVNAQKDPTPENCPYLKKKGLSADVIGTSVRHDGKGDLIVPAHDINGRVHSMQVITATGFKRFLEKARKHGLMHAIDPEDKLGKVPIVIAEGFSTAASVHQATKLPVVVAFDAGNLRPVAEALREKHPEQAIIIAADNDFSKKVNAGIKHAHSAAVVVGGTVIAPTLGESDRRLGLTDFNDIACAHGAAAVRKEFGDVLKLSQQKQLTPDIGPENSPQKPPERPISKTQNISQGMEM